MKINLRSALLATAACGALMMLAASSSAADGYQIFVSNEHSGTITVISGGDFKVTDTISVGKRPRGIHASPDGKTVYVALSGTPIEAPPTLDTNGNPVFVKGHDDDDDDVEHFEGKIDGLIYDHFGDFQGVVFETETGARHEFFSHQQAIHDLAETARHARSHLAVTIGRHHRDILRVVVLRRPTRLDGDHDHDR